MKLKTLFALALISLLALAFTAIASEPRTIPFLGAPASSPAR